MKEFNMKEWISPLGKMFPLYGTVCETLRGTSFSTGKAGLSFSLAQGSAFPNGLRCHIMNVTAL